MSQKLEDYYARGQRALSVEEVSQVVSKHPFLRPPDHVFLLNGVIDAPHGTAIGYTPHGESVIVLTPLSNQETVLHELIHQSTGLGEAATQVLARILRRKEQFTLLRRPVQFAQCDQAGGCRSTQEILQQLRLQPVTGRPGIEHLVLLDQMFQIGTRIPAGLTHYVLIGG